MGLRVQPIAWVYTCAGASIGALAVLFLPQNLTSPPRNTLSAELRSASAVILPDDLSSIISAATATSTSSAAAIKTWTKEITLRAGDTLSDLLSRAGLERTHAFQVIDAIRTIYNPRRLQAGQKFILNFVADDDKASTLDALAFELDPSHTVAVDRDEAGNYAAHSIMAETHQELLRFDGIIDSSLFAAAEEQGVPMDVMAEMVRLYSYDVDFQRDIQRGDKFSLMYERTVTADGRPVRSNGIKYASMTLRGTPLRLYAFTDQDGATDFYNEKGEGVRKALMRTPINGARLTSGFGLRRHPILGYSKMHQGIDFGASTGTPIFAAGDGVIEKRGPNGGYGNYIRIRHHSGYSTAYAHMSRFASDAKQGRRVKQGQVIGYVGTTGRSTGPHLHFEVLRNNKQVNPMTVKMPASDKLQGKVLVQFNQSRAQIEQQLAALAVPRTVASAATSPSNTKIK